MNDTKKKGNLTELQCMTAFMEIGAVVSIPFGEDSRYDFIADINGKLLKIQCKSSKEVLDDDGNVIAIAFKTVRMSGSNSKKHWRTKYSKDEIDYFSTFYNGVCYVVSVEECSNEKRLRFVLPKQDKKNINYAKDYDLKGVYEKL